MNYRIIIVLVFVFLNVCTFPLLAQNLHVMTYNIRFDNPNDGENAWPNRKNKVFTLLKQYDADVIGIQEALDHQLNEIISALPEYAFIGVGRDDGKTKGEYSAILYKKDKFTVSDSETFWLSETPKVPGSKSWDAAITRLVTVAKFTERSTNKSFYMLNTHFDHIGEKAREKSAGMITDKVKTLSLPVIVTGDLNSTRSDEAYKILTKKDKCELIDPAKGSTEGTFCTFGVNSAECTGIDYIVHTKEWTAKDYKVIKDNDGKNYPSDHLPVMITLAIK